MLGPRFHASSAAILARRRKERRNRRRASPWGACGWSEGLLMQNPQQWLRCLAPEGVPDYYSALTSRMAVSHGPPRDALL